MEMCIIIRKREVDRSSRSGTDEERAEEEEEEEDEEDEEESVARGMSFSSAVAVSNSSIHIASLAHSLKEEEEVGTGGKVKGKECEELTFADRVCPPPNPLSVKPLSPSSVTPL